MRFGGEVDDSVDLVLGEEFCDEGGVADVAVGENVARVAGEVGEIGRIARVGPDVEVHNGDGAAAAQDVPDEIRPDKAKASRHQELHRAGACSLREEK